MSWYRPRMRPAELLNLVNELRRNPPWNLHGTDRNRSLVATINWANWFRPVPLEFRCVVPLYLNEKKEWFRWFRRSALRASQAGSQ